jgi:hypothetical protein
MYPHSMLGESHNCWCFQYIIPKQHIVQSNLDMQKQWKHLFLQPCAKIGINIGGNFICYALYEGLFIIWLIVVNNHRCKHLCGSAWHLWNNFFLKQHFKSELGDCKKLHNEAQREKQPLELNNFKNLIEMMGKSNDFLHVKWCGWPCNKLHIIL